MGLCQKLVNMLKLQDPIHQFLYRILILLELKVKHRGEFRKMLFSYDFQRKQPSQNHTTYEQTKIKNKLHVQ
jgi:hypothetical protein